MVKRWFLFWGIFIFILGLAGCKTENPAETRSSSSTSREKIERTEKEEIKSKTPTLFIHGYSGTQRSFGGMLQRFEEAKEAKQEMTLTVLPDGTVQSQGQLSGKADNPMVQVLFADNKNNEWNQSDWIKNCLSYLKTTYGTEKVNLVGHSMGGVSGFRYLVTYGKDASLPEVDKFISLGAPFNEFVMNDPNQTMENENQVGPSIHSPRYDELLQLVDNLPITTQYLLIGGQLSDTDLSDGTVPLSSSLAAYSLIASQKASVAEKVIKGANAQHSQLHENAEVDNLIKQFIW